MSLLKLVRNDGACLGRYSDEAHAIRFAIVLGYKLLGGRLVREDGSSVTISPVTAKDRAEEAAKLAQGRAAVKLAGRMPQGDRANESRRRGGMRTRRGYIGLGDVKPEMARAWREQRAAGKAVIALAAEAGIAAPTMSRICRGDALRSAGGPFTRAGRQ